MQSIWTGGNKLDWNSGWIWYGLATFPYINWDISEPNNYNGDVISMDAQTGKWKVDFESEQRGIGCKYPRGGTPETSCGDNCFQEIVCEDQTQRITCGPITSYSYEL